MTTPAFVNGSARALHCPFAGRHVDESLHDFLLRRHDEMGTELTLLHRQVEFQAECLREARWAAHRSTQWLIAAAVLDTCFALMIFLAWVLSVLPTSLAVLGVVALVSGNLIVIGMPVLERALGRIRARRRA